MRKLVLYHGGNLRDGVLASVNHKKGRWEYGPGLYLTTNYQTASKYAKGSRKLYKVVVEEGTDITDVEIDSQKVFQFVKAYVIKSKVKDVLSRLNKWNKNDTINADTFLNILVNDDAVAPNKTDELRKFLVENGADYSIVKNAFGWHETMLVVFNFDKITSTKESKSEYDDLPTEFSESAPIKNPQTTSFDDEYPTYKSMIDGVNRGELLVHARRLSAEDVSDLQFGLEPTIAETLSDTEAIKTANEYGISPVALVFASDGFKWVGGERNGIVFVRKDAFQKSLGNGMVELSTGKIVRYERSPIADFENDALKEEPYGVETNDWYTTKTADVVGVCLINGGPVRESISKFDKQYKYFLNLI